MSTNILYRSLRAYEGEEHNKELEREQLFEDSQEDRENRFEDSQEDRENRFNDFITSSGYQFLGDYAAGIEFTEHNQIVRDSDGEFWRLSGQVELPYTTTGAGLSEEGNFVAVGDAVLRQELGDPSLAKKIISFDKGVGVGSPVRELLSTSGGLSLGQRKPQCVVTFIDDDGKTSILTKLKPIYDSKGIKSGFAPILSLIGNKINHLGWSEVQGLVDDGWEVMSHLVNDVRLDEISDEQKEFELSESRKAFEDRGMDCRFLVPPYGRDGDLSGRNLTRKYYRGSFISTYQSQHVPLRSIGIVRKELVLPSPENNPTLEELKAYVDEAEQNNLWAVFSTHAEYGGMTEEHQQVIADLIDYIQSKNIPIETPSNAMDMVGNFLEIGDDRDPSGNYLKIDANGKLWPNSAKSVEFTALGVSGQTPINEFRQNVLDIRYLNFQSVGFPEEHTAGILETTYRQSAGEYFGRQVFTSSETGNAYIRSWNRYKAEWFPWITMSPMS